jgi:hypothetical protein
MSIGFYPCYLANLFPFNEIMHFQKFIFMFFVISHIGSERPEPGPY